MKIVKKSLLVLGLAGMLLASPRGGSCENLCVPKGEGHNLKGPEMMHKKIFSELNLSKEQEIKIKEIYKKYLGKDKDTEACPSMMDIRKSLMEELDTAEPSEDKLKELKKEIVSRQEKQLDEMIQMKKEINSVLTKEQIIKLKEIIKKRAGKMKEMKKDKTK